MKESNNLLLSIVVPIYNVEEYIHACLESIFNQGLDENMFEVILINDGTKDRSMEVIQDIVCQHNNITIINQENQGISVARNNGIAAAKGEYILMPDSDDLLIKNSLKPLLGKAIESQADLVIGDYIIMSNSEIDTTNIPLPDFDKIMVLEKTGEQMFFEYLKPGQYIVWRTLYRNDFLQNQGLNFVPGIYVQDRPYTHEVYLKAKKCLVIPWPFYIYRKHNESVSFSMTEKYAKDYCIAINKMWELSLTEGLSHKIKVKMRDYTFNTINMMIWRLIHEIKDKNKRAEIIDYLNIIAPSLYFNHGIKQVIITYMLKKTPHIYLRLRTLYSIVWEDKINPFLMHLHNF